MRTLIIAATAFLSTPALASCMAIQDYDKRQACFAEERRSPEGCTSIRSSDDRALCQQRAKADRRPWWESERR